MNGRMAARNMSMAWLSASLLGVCELGMGWRFPAFSRLSEGMIGVRYDYGAGAGRVNRLGRIRRGNRILLRESEHRPEALPIPARPLSFRRRGEGYRSELASELAARDNGKTRAERQDGRTRLAREISRRAAHTRWRRDDRARPPPIFTDAACPHTDARRPAARLRRNGSSGRHGRDDPRRRRP